MRVHQWYKNTIIFLPLLFSGNVLLYDATLATIIGFFAFSLIASGNYIINDILDVRHDRKHPEKKHRPIASGALSRIRGIFFAGILLIAGFVIAALLSGVFFAILAGYLVVMVLYSAFLKHYIFVDILVIGSGFVARAIAGVYVLSNAPYVLISPWLIICTFFLALFLVIAKRKADVVIGSKKTEYTIPMLDMMLAMVGGVLILSYVLYLVLNHSIFSLITVPFLVYGVFQYIHLIMDNSAVARNPERAYKDLGLVIAGIAIILIMIIVLYGGY